MAWCSVKAQGQLFSNVMLIIYIQKMHSAQHNIGVAIVFATETSCLSDISQTMCSAQCNICVIILFSSWGPNLGADVKYFTHSWSSVVVRDE